MPCSSDPGTPSSTPRIKGWGGNWDTAETGVVTAESSEQGDPDWAPGTSQEVCKSSGYGSQ